MRSDRCGQHIRAVGMRAVVGARSRLAFAVGLYQKTAEVRNQAVNLIRLSLPPGNHFRIERVSSFQSIQIDRGREARRKIDANAVRPERVGQRRDLAQIFGREDLRIGVNVVEDGSVYPD